MAPARRATTLALLWLIVLLAWTTRVVGWRRPARAEPLLRAMETIALGRARRSPRYAKSFSIRSL